MRSGMLEAAFIASVSAGGLMLSAASGAAGDSAGKTLYEKKCAKCHGDTGDGKGRAAKKLEHTKYLALNDKKRMSEVSDDQMFKTIKEGGDKVSFKDQEGKTVNLSDEMESFSDKLSDGEIRDVMAYIRTFTK